VPDVDPTPRVDELRLFVQPLVDLAGRHVAGWEALVRWELPSGGYVDPGAFIPAAERNGAIHDIGAWVLARAVAWRSARSPEQVVGVNTSAVQLERAGFADAVAQCLGAYGLPAHQLMVELTETARITDPSAVIATMERLRALGVLVAIDDAGCGFSDEALIRALPADVLKLDEALIGGLPGDDDLEAAARWVELGAELGMRVVAEGIRTEEQARMVRALGCAWGQGDLYGPPVPAA
jgi:EAL domain-containing protein (putative c-di-GMP-specific phosphodiesterase class I)